MKRKASRRKETIKIRTEINKTEKQQRKNSVNPKSWLFEKTNKSYTPVVSVAGSSWKQWEGRLRKEQE